MGKMVRNMRFHQGTFTMRAASSISLESCNIALIPLRDAKGRYLMEPTKMRMKKVFAIPKEDPIARNAAPIAIEGIR